MLMALANRIRLWLLRIFSVAGSCRSPSAVIVLWATDICNESSSGPRHIVRVY
jgi:hypothetical protein